MKRPARQRNPLSEFIREGQGRRFSLVDCPTTSRMNAFLQKLADKPPTTAEFCQKKPNVHIFAQPHTSPCIASQAKTPASTSSSIMPTPPCTCLSIQ